MDDDLRAQLDLMVRAGFLPRDEIVEAMGELVEDADEGMDPERLAAAVDDAIAALRAESRTWPAVTDNDRLEQAFARLTAEGVIARQDFACCSSCAHSEIWDEVADRDAWAGYVWFHRQDTERAVAGDGLYLGYGARDDRSRARRFFGISDGETRDAAAIGREITRALGDAGLPVVWDGRVETRILVDPFEWRRRPG